MKKKIKDCTKKEIYKEIYENTKSSISCADHNCFYCKYFNQNCCFQCEKEYENCIDFEAIIYDCGEEEIEVEEMTNLEWIRNEKEQIKTEIEELNIKDSIWYSLMMNFKNFEQIEKELEKFDKIKFLIKTGDIFSPAEFYDQYDMCLKGDGHAVFITKELEIMNDNGNEFSKGWQMLEDATKKYNSFSRWECKLAFVIWFNR